jgi:hypothetical protein
MAVYFRLHAAMHVLMKNQSEARRRGLLRGEGAVWELSHAFYFAAAEAPCSRMTGFGRRQLFAEASRIHEAGLLVKRAG